MPIGSEGLTLRGDADKFVSNRDKEFRIDMVGETGLYQIIMSGGGKAPKICQGLYTGYNLAARDLELYLRKGDRLGRAEFPSKDK